MEKFDLENTEFFKYLRTANGKQGIGIQEYIVNNFCNENNIKAKTYIDDGFSGLDLNRASLKKMFEDIEKSKYKNIIIIVNDFARLTRNYKDGDKILSNKNKNIKVYSVTDNSFINRRNIIQNAIQNYYLRPSIEEVLGSYEQHDIRTLLSKISIDNNGKIKVPKNELFTGDEKQMIKELKEKWKSPYEIDEGKRIKQAKKRRNVIAEDEDMEM